MSDAPSIPGYRFVPISELRPSRRYLAVSLRGDVRIEGIISGLRTRAAWKDLPGLFIILEDYWFYEKVEKQISDNMALLLGDGYRDFTPDEFAAFLEEVKTLPPGLEWKASYRHGDVFVEAFVSSRYYAVKEGLLDG